MKKSLLCSTAVLSALAMASCSKDDVTNVAPSENNGVSQVIEIAVDNGGDGLTTRAGRPLFSSEAKQTIEKVTVVVCNATDNKVVAKFDEANWQGVSESYDDASGHGRKIRFTFAEGEELGEGNYNVYAFGYHTASDVTSQYKVGDQDLGAYLSGLDTEGNSTLTKDLKITNSETGDTYNAEELFAGSTTISVTKADNDFSVGMTLHRQVAGIYAYVMNIPYIKGAKYLDLYAEKRNNDLVLGHFYDAVLGANGTVENGEKVNNQVNVVNGTNESAQRTLVSRITLTDWFTEIQDVNNDGIIDRYGYKKSDDGKTLVENTAEQIWKNPYTSNKVNFVKGSAFSGEFIIPFQKGNSQTFVLELRNDDSDLRTWNINLPSLDLINNEDLTIWGESDWNTSAASGESQSAYSVLRNHLYSVGTKSTENPGGGTDPEEPTPGTEDPEDLSTKQDLLLQVNDNWELIHKMEID